MAKDTTIWDKVERSLTAPAPRTGTSSSEAAERPKSPWSTRRQRIARDLVCWLGWLYIPTKLFVVDIDRKIMESIHQGMVGLLDYKFFAFLAIFAACLLFFRSRTILFVAYFAFFPFVVLCWKLPRFLISAPSWLPLVAVTNVVSNIVTQLRYQVVTKTAWLVSALLILATDIRWFVIPSMVAMFSILALSYFRTLRGALRPSRFLRAHEYAVTRVQDFSLVKSMTSYTDEIRGSDVEKLSSAQLQEFSNGINFSLLFNRAVYFWAYQLDKYRRSPVPFALSMASYVGLFIATVLTLTFINLGLLHLDPSSFDYPEVPSFARVLYYSMSSLYLNGVSGIDPASDLALLVTVAGGFMGVILLTTVVANAIYSTMTRDDAAMAETIDKIKQQGEALENRLIEEYEVASYDDAVRRVEQMGGGLLSIIGYIARQVPDDFYGRGK